MAILVKFGEFWFDHVTSVFYLHFFFLMACAYGGHLIYRQLYCYPFICLISTFTFILSYFVCVKFLVLGFLFFGLFFFNPHTLQLCNLGHLNQSTPKSKQGSFQLWVLL